MRAYTDRTKQRPDDLRDEFMDIQRIGYAECVEEIELGVSSVAAPIRIGNIGATLSIGATGPVRRFSGERRSEIGEILKQYGSKIAAALQLYVKSEAW